MTHLHCSELKTAEFVWATHWTHPYPLYWAASCALGSDGLWMTQVVSATTILFTTVSVICLKNCAERKISRVGSYRCLSLQSVLAAGDWHCCPLRLVNTRDVSQYSPNLDIILSTKTA